MITSLPQSGQLPQRAGSIPPGGAVLDQGADVAADPSHKDIGVELAALNFFKFFLPLPSHLRRFEQGVLDEGDQVAAHVGAAQLFFLALDIVAAEQGFDDGGTGSGRADAALFERLTQGVVFDKFTGGFHGAEQRVFGEVTGRFGLAFAQARLMRAGFPIGEGRESLVVGSVLAHLLFREENGPAWLNNLGTFGLKFYLLADAVNRGHMFDADRIEGGDELGGDCVIDELIIGAQVARPDTGGDNGVMVGHLGVVDDPAGEREFSEVERRDLFGPHGLELFHDFGNARFQVFAKIP